MRWQGETYQQKVSRLECWHRWFAWHPVQMDSWQWVWLEPVRRKGSFSYCDDLVDGWYYRPMEEE